MWTSHFNDSSGILNKMSNVKKFFILICLGEFLEPPYSRNKDVDSRRLVVGLMIFTPNFLLYFFAKIIYYQYSW